METHRYSVTTRASDTLGYLQDFIFNYKKTNYKMKIVHSDYDEQNTEIKLDRLNIRKNEIDRTREDTGTGFVFFKTRDHKEADILRWEMVNRRTNSNLVVKRKPNRVACAMDKAIGMHDKSDDVVALFTFYRDPVENPEIDEIEKYIIGIMNWERRGNVTTGEDILSALEWAANN